jgi:hypothetical protein
MTSKNIAKIGENDDSVYYIAQCGCGERSHSAGIEFEHESIGIDLRFYKDVCFSDSWTCDNILQKYLRRIKAAFRILFKGYIEMEEVFFIRGVEQITDLISALEYGKNKMIEAEKRAKSDHQECIISKYCLHCTHYNNCADIGPCSRFMLGD